MGAFAGVGRQWRLATYLEGARWLLMWIAPPDLLYPKFDPGALGNLQSTCADPNTGHEQAEACALMEKRDWFNGAQEESLAIHHWSHTWLGAVDTGNTVDVKEVAGKRLTGP